MKASRNGLALALSVGLFVVTVVLFSTMLTAAVVGILGLLGMGTTEVTSP